MFHEVTEGVISPIQDENDGITLYETSKDYSRCVTSLIYASDERFMLFGHGAYYYHPLPMPSGRAELKAQDEEVERHFDEFDKTANHTSGHYSRLDCLLQPPITYVNRQIRAESLSLFYQINKFHFELDNFVLNRPRDRQNETKIPPDWWRAIGDHNLRSIADLNMFGQCFQAHPYEGNMIKYRKVRAVKVEMTTSKTPAYTELRWPSTVVVRRIFRAKERQAERDVRLRKMLNKIEADGISVKALEKLTALLEPPSKEYLRDYSMLDHDDLLRFALP